LNPNLAAPTPSRAPVGFVLAGLVAALAAWVAYALARHPGFQPAYTLRTAAPILALMLGAAFTHLVAKVRQRTDVDGEFNPGGRALFLGVVMLVVTMLGWLVISQALPATVTAVFGVQRPEAGLVVQKIPAAADPDCRYRLELASASAAGGHVTRAMDECVSEDLWNHAAQGGPVTLDLVVSALGAEIVGVRP
jgi:hypothetical protein